MWQPESACRILGGIAMRLNEYEMQFLHRFIGQINIQLIPENYFAVATILHERLGNALKAIQNRRLSHDRKQS
jgi:hypothetical protein